jgi:hypothetical protein
VRLLTSEGAHSREGPGPPVGARYGPGFGRQIARRPARGQLPERTVGEGAAQTRASADFLACARHREARGVESTVVACDAQARPERGGARTAVHRPGGRLSRLVVHLHSGVCCVGFASAGCCVRRPPQQGKPAAAQSSCRTTRLLDAATTADFRTTTRPLGRGRGLPQRRTRTGLPRARAVAALPPCWHCSRASTPVQNLTHGHRRGSNRPWRPCLAHRGGSGGPLLDHPESADVTAAFVAHRPTSGTRMSTSTSTSTTR